MLQFYRGKIMRTSIKNKLLFPTIIISLLVSACGGSKGSSSNNSHSVSSSESSSSMTSDSKSSSDPISSSIANSSSSIAPNSSSSQSSSAKPSSSSVAPHIHEFKEIKRDDCKKYDADCEVALTYYKSCECGKKSSETFTVGSPLSHDYQLSSKFSGKQCSKCSSAILEGCTEAFVSTETKTVSEFLTPFGAQAFAVSMLASALKIKSLEKRVFYYESVDAFGNKIILDGSVTIPKGDDGYIIDRFVLDNHPTFESLSESVDRAWTQTSITAIVGSCTLEFDLIGYGITSCKTCEYHCSHLSNRNTVDGALACFRLLKTIGVEQYSKPICITGYSQGGYDALSLMRYLETEATAEEKRILDVDVTLAGSGAYNLQYLFEDALKDDKFSRPEYIIAGFLSAYETHKDLFDGHKPEDFLTDYGMEFIYALSKKSVAENTKVKEKKKPDGKPYFTKMSDIFVSDCLDENSELAKIIKSVFEQENLIDGKWIPESKLFLWYTEADEIVSPRCSQAAIELFKDLDEEKFKYEYEKESAKLLHVPGGTQFYSLVVIRLVAIL